MVESLNFLLQGISILIQMGKRPRLRSLQIGKELSLIKSDFREFISRFLLDEELVDQLTRGFKSIRLPLLTVA
jgi:hypothetical protein